MLIYTNIMLAEYRKCPQCLPKQPSRDKCEVLFESFNKTLCKGIDKKSRSISPANYVAQKIINRESMDRIFCKGESA